MTQRKVITVPLRVPSKMFDLREAWQWIFARTAGEREQQMVKWGKQRHPHHNGSRLDRKAAADEARNLCDAAAKAGTVTWAHILLEEVAEAIAEDDPYRKSNELVQVMAVVTAQMEQLYAEMNGEEAPCTPTAPDQASTLTLAGRLA